MYVHTANAMNIPTAQTSVACDVCRLLDGDVRPKPCTFCGICRAWLCEACKRSPIRRAKAALKMRFGR